MDRTGQRHRVVVVGGGFGGLSVVRAPLLAEVTFVIVGAGPTGVELTGQVAELAHRVLVRDYRAIDPRSARQITVEQAHDQLVHPALIQIDEIELEPRRSP